MSKPRITITLSQEALAALKRMHDEEQLSKTTVINQGVKVCDLANRMQGAGYHLALVKYEDGHPVTVEAIALL